MTNSAQKGSGTVRTLWSGLRPLPARIKKIAAFDIRLVFTQQDAPVRLTDTLGDTAAVVANVGKSLYRL